MPVTLAVLRLLKIELNHINETYEYKRLIWAVCTLNFFGALRVHESLSRNVSFFDPLNTLLRRDVAIKSVLVGKQQVKIIQLRIKSPKESRQYSYLIIIISILNINIKPILLFINPYFV